MENYADSKDIIFLDKAIIYTPPVSGIGSINKKTYSAMCNRKEVTIKVKGSAMDDLNSHHTQVR